MVQKQISYNIHKSGMCSPIHFLSMDLLIEFHIKEVTFYLGWLSFDCFQSLILSLKYVIFRKFGSLLIVFNTNLLVILENSTITEGLIATLD